MEDYFPDLKRTIIRWSKFTPSQKVSFWFRSNHHGVIDLYLWIVKHQLENVWFQKYSRFEQICPGDTTLQISRELFEACYKHRAVK